MNTFGRGDDLDLHPTVKPIQLIADVILDCTKRNDIVLDPFLGSGSTLLAAERANRRGYGIELDPLYVDTAVERWQKMTGQKAHNRFGETYDMIKEKSSEGQPVTDTSDEYPVGRGALPAFTVEEGPKRQ